MRIRNGVVPAASMALVFGLVGCGGAPNNGASTTSAPGGARPLVTRTKTHPQVKPVNATLQAKVGQPITFRVSSDAADELHVHSVPDHEFKVAAAPNQTFQFSVNVPGNVDVELHHLDRTVATIQVRP